MSSSEDMQEANAAILELVPNTKSPLSQLQVVGEREGGLLECHVPLEFIQTEDVAVDNEHVNELAQSMIDEQERVNGTGQLTPLLLGYIVIDGFHRAKALKIANVDLAYATVRQSTLEEIIDLRILTARMHKSVQFARIIEWVNDSWNHSAWQHQISVGQAFALHRTHSTGKQLGVAEEAPDIKAWVDKKCEQWQISAATIFNNLSLASIADPTLVQEARVSRGGRNLLYLTPGHLKVIAQQMPNQFPKQRLVADLAKQHNLRIPETRSIAKLVADAQNVAEAREILDDVNWKRYEPEARAVAKAQMIVPNVEASLDTLHSGPDGVLSPIDVALTRIALVIAEVAAAGNASSQRNYLVTTRNELATFGQRIVSMARLIEGMIAQSGKPGVRLLVAQPKVLSVVTQLQPLKTDQPEQSTALTVYQEGGPSAELTSFLMGNGEVPSLLTKSDILRAERLIAKPPLGASLVHIEDMREEVRRARNVLASRDGSDA
jgi:hypothetical protein